MGELKYTWALDTTDPKELAAMEKALDEKLQLLREEREREKASEKKAV